MLANHLAVRVRSRAGFPNLLAVSHHSCFARIVYKQRDRIVKGAKCGNSRTLLTSRWATPSAGRESLAEKLPGVPQAFLVDAMTDAR